MYQVKSQLASEEIQLKLILAPNFAFILLPPSPCPVNFERFKQWPHRLEGGSLNVTKFDVIHSQDPSLLVTLKHVQFPYFVRTSQDLRGPTPPAPARMGVLTPPPAYKELKLRRQMVAYIFIVSFCTIFLNTIIVRWPTFIEIPEL